MRRDDNVGNFVCLCGKNSTGSVSIPCPRRSINFPSCHARAPWAAWKSRSRRPYLGLRHRFTHRGVVRDALRARFRDDVHSRYAAVGEDHEDAYEASDCHGCCGCVDDAPRRLLLPSWLCRLRRAWLRGRTCLCARLRSGLCARLWLFIGHHRGRRRLRELRLWRRLEPAATTAAEIWRSGLWRSWLRWPRSSAPLPVMVVRRRVALATAALRRAMGKRRDRPVDMPGRSANLVARWVRRR